MTDTIDLGTYFFQGDDFNWKNVALTIQAWRIILPPESYSDNKALDLTAYVNTDNHAEFWLTYQEVELVFNLGSLYTVQWCTLNDEENFRSVTTKIVLPRNPDELLLGLGLSAHSAADNIVAFWARFLQFLKLRLEPLPEDE